MPNNPDDPNRSENFFIGGDLKPIYPAAPTSATPPSPPEHSPWDDFLSPALPPLAPVPPSPAAAPSVAVTLPKVQALTQLYLKQYLEFEQGLVSQAINVTQADQGYAMMTMDYRAIQGKNLARINFILHVLGEMKLWKSQLDQISKLSGADQPEISALLSDASSRVQQAIDVWTDGRQKCVEGMKSIATSMNDVQNLLGDIARGISDTTKNSISQNNQINSQFLDIFRQ